MNHEVRPLEFGYSERFPIDGEEDDFSLIASKAKEMTLDLPKPNKWSARWLDVVYTPSYEHKVRWWHRWFTSMFFGIKWVKTDTLHDKPLVRP